MQLQTMNGSVCVCVCMCVCVWGGKGDGEGGEGERVHKGPRIAETILKKNKVEAYPTKNKTNKEIVFNITCY